MDDVLVRFFPGNYYSIIKAIIEDHCAMFTTVPISNKNSEVETHIGKLCFYSCKAVSWAELYCGALGFFCFVV